MCNHKLLKGDPWIQIKRKEFFLMNRLDFVSPTNLLMCPIGKSFAFRRLVVRLEGLPRCACAQLRSSAAHVSDGLCPHEALHLHHSFTHNYAYTCPWR